MNVKLPNYFLADLPPEAPLTSKIIGEACHALVRNREQYLARRSTDSLIEVISQLAAAWREPGNRFRRMALELGPAATDFSSATLAAGLEAFFSELTAENLNALLVQELGHSQRLDALVASPGETDVRALATGPELLVHITAGNIPVPAMMSIVLGLLVRSAQFVKCATGTSLLPRLFAHSLYEAEPKLGACLEIAEWRGGNAQLEAPLFRAAECVTATGSDETLAQIRVHVPPRVRFLGYGHRVSFGYIAHEALTPEAAGDIAAQAANDVAAWNQLGCLSPHLFYVEAGGGLLPEQFAEALAAELEKREAAEPRGDLPVELSATIASKRGFYQVRAAHSPDTRLWASKDSTAWTVVYEADPTFQLSCLNRFIYVKGVRTLADALHGAALVRGHISTVGLAATAPRATELATRLGRWGATRICPLGRMQRPPLSWRHDGRPGLGDLVTWTNWEL